MDNLARKISLVQEGMAAARIVGVDGRCLMLEEGGRVYDARRSAGCLLAPEPGDLVMAVHLGKAGAYVLDVLERASDEPATIEVQQGLQISAPEGRLGISARDGVEIVSPSRARLAASQVEVTGGEGVAAFGKLDLTAGSLVSRMGSVRLAVQKLESALGRVIESIKNRFAKVEGLDRLEAGTISREAEDLYSARARFTMVTADEDVKLDGEMIHLG